MQGGAGALGITLMLFFTSVVQLRQNFMPNPFKEVHAYETQCQESTQG
jgi:hypothetical protein